MAVLFIVALGIGAALVAATLLFSHFISGRTGARPPFTLVSRSAALMGVGAGGLVSTWAGFGSFGLGASIIVGAIVFMLLIYRVVIPLTQRRLGNSANGETP